MPAGVRSKNLCYCYEPVISARRRNTEVEVFQRLRNLTDNKYQICEKFVLYLD